MAWYDSIPGSGLVKTVLNGGNTGSTAPLTAAGAMATGTATGLGAERTALGPNPYAIDTTNSDFDRRSQLETIGALRAAAAGTAPSAAEMQLRQQSANNNAAAFGAAAALKGRTPGASFTTAARQNAETQLQTNATAAQLRAAEMAQSRAALASAGATQQAQDVQAAQTAAALKSNYAGQLLGGQLTSQGQGVTAAGGITNANVQNAQTQNSFTGGILGGVGSALVASDEDEKHDIKDANIAEAFGKVEPKTFKYDHPDMPGEAPGNRVGVIAQNVAHQPALRSMVIDGKPMQLDVGNALGLALAALSDHQREIDELKSRRKAA